MLMLDWNRQPTGVVKHPNIPYEEGQTNRVGWKTKANALRIIFQRVISWTTIHFRIANIRLPIPEPSSTIKKYSTGIAKPDSQISIMLQPKNLSKKLLSIKSLTM